MNTDSPRAAGSGESARQALLEADDRAERMMPLKGLASALVLIAIGWARARWWM